MHRCWFAVRVAPGAFSSVKPPAMVISGLHDLCRNHLVDGYYASRSLKPTWALVTAAPRRDVTDKNALMPLAHLHNLEMRGYQAIPAYATLLFRAAVTPDETASQPTHTLLAVINSANTNEVHVRSRSVHPVRRCRRRTIPDFFKTWTGCGWDRIPSLC